MDEEHDLGREADRGEMHHRRRDEIVAPRSCVDISNGQCNSSHVHDRTGKYVPSGTPPAAAPAVSSDSMTNFLNGNSVAGLTSNFVLLFCTLLCIANIAALASHRRESDDHCQLGNGDYVGPCPDRLGDERCFVVMDVTGRIIYRSEGERRLLGFNECSKGAIETNSHKCIGEYAFSNNASVVWYHRLYLNETDKTYSLICGPNIGDHSYPVPRVRHLLSYPFNWIISYDPIPANTYPKQPLFIDGDVLVRNIWHLTKTKKYNKNDQSRMSNDEAEMNLHQYKMYVAETSTTGPK